MVASYTLISFLYIVIAFDHCNADPRSQRLIDQRIASLRREKITRPMEPPGLRIRKKTQKLSRRSYLREFDARKQWPYCSQYIDDVWSQRNCPGTWAFSAAALMNIRHCIEHDGRMDFTYSVEDILECSDSKRDGKNSCDSGHPVDALNYWTKVGVVTGGDYLSSNGCKPIKSSVATRGRVPYDCQKECDNFAYTVPYAEDQRKGNGVWRVHPTVANIKYEIMSYGPVVACFVTYDDYARHVNNSVYVHQWGEPFGQTSVVLFGWGEEFGIPFWYAMQFWGMEDFKVNGVIKIVRGRNVGKLEESVYAATSVGDDELGKQHMWEYNGSGSQTVMTLLWVLLPCFINFFVIQK